MFLREPNNLIFMNHSRTKVVGYACVKPQYFIPDCYMAVRIVYSFSNAVRFVCGIFTINQLQM